MARRRLLGCLLVPALALGASSACKDNGDEARTKANGPDLDKRCVQLAKVCGDKDKHVAKILDECKQAAKQQIEKGCPEKVTALYDCYERELCGNGDKVWTIEDLPVLAERKRTCVAEREASRTCSKK